MRLRNADPQLKNVFGRQNCRKSPPRSGGGNVFASPEVV